MKESTFLLCYHSIQTFVHIDKTWTIKRKKPINSRSKKCSKLLIVQIWNDIWKFSLLNQKVGRIEPEAKPTQSIIMSWNRENVLIPTVDIFYYHKGSDILHYFHSPGTFLKNQALEKDINPIHPSYYESLTG